MQNYVVTRVMRGSCLRISSMSGQREKIY